MWFIPRDKIFRAGTQRVASCVFENVTYPCPVDSEWWLINEYGKDYMKPDHTDAKEYFDYYNWDAYDEYGYLDPDMYSFSSGPNDNADD